MEASEAKGDFTVIPSSQSQILMVGNDPPLAYLLGRDAKQSGLNITPAPMIPKVEDICALKPAAILFPSIEILESAQLLIAGLVNCDIPVLVCSSIADEARAHELGADYCLLHPLTNDGFTAAFVARVHLEWPLAREALGNIIEAPATDDKEELI